MRRVCEGVRSERGVFVVVVAPFERLDGLALLRGLGARGDLLGPQ